MSLYGRYSGSWKIVSKTTVPQIFSDFQAERNDRVFFTTLICCEKKDIIFTKYNEQKTQEILTFFNVMSNAQKYQLMSNAAFTAS